MQGFFIIMVKKKVYEGKIWAATFFYVKQEPKFGFDNYRLENFVLLKSFEFKHEIKYYRKMLKKLDISKT